MLGRLRKVFSGNSAASSAEAAVAPTEISAGNAPALLLPQFFVQHENVPLLDGHRLTSWLNDNVPVESRTSMLNEAKRAWLLHVRDALGASFQVTESNNACVLSSLEPTKASTTANFMDNALEQVLGACPSLATIWPEWIWQRS